MTKKMRNTKPKRKPLTMLPTDSKISTRINQTTSNKEWSMTQQTDPNWLNSWDSRPPRLTELFLSKNMLVASRTGRMRYNRSREIMKKSWRRVLSSKNYFWKDMKSCCLTDHSMNSLSRRFRSKKTINLSMSVRNSIFLKLTKKNASLMS